MSGFFQNGFHHVSHTVGALCPDLSKDSQINTHFCCCWNEHFGSQKRAFFLYFLYFFCLSFLYILSVGALLLISLYFDLMVD